MAWAGRKIALRKTQAKQGAMGAGVKVADHDYFALRVRLADAARGGGAVEADFIVDTAAGASFVTPDFAARTAAQPTGVTASVSTGTGGGGGLSMLSLGRMQVHPVTLVHATAAPRRAGRQAARRAPRRC